MKRISKLFCNNICWDEDIDRITFVGTDDNIFFSIKWLNMSI